MEKLCKFLERRFALLFAIIICGCTVLYLMLAFGKYVWVDEAYTFALIAHSYKEIWQITAADVHPPLYYFVTKFFTSPFQYSLLSAKIVSIVPYVFVLVFGGIEFKKYFGKKAAILFICLFFAFPFSLPYAIEVRMYSLAAAFVFANAVFAYRCYKEDGIKNWVVFALCGTGAAYTHYFALVSVGIVYVLLFVAIIITRKKQIKPWILSSFLTVVLYLPWLGEFIKQLAYKISHEYWIDDITLRTLFEYCRSVFGAGGMTTFALFSALTYLVSFLYILINKKSVPICICALLVPVCTIGVGVIASILVRPVFVIRYVIPAIPLLITFMALAINEMQSEFLVASVLTVALMGGVSNYGTQLYGEYKTRENELDAAFVSTYRYCDSYIALTETPHIPGVLCYYERETPVYYENHVSGDNPYENHRALPQFDEAENKTVVMLLDVGETPSKEYTQTYSYEYMGEVHENGHPFDVFLLKWKNNAGVQ